MAMMYQSLNTLRGNDAADAVSANLPGSLDTLRGSHFADAVSANAKNHWTLYAETIVRTLSAQTFQNHWARYAETILLVSANFRISDTFFGNHFADAVSANFPEAVNTSESLGTLSFAEAVNTNVANT